MAVEVFSDDPFPSLPGPTRDSVLNALSSFHNEAFPAQITNPASTLRRPSTKRSKGPVHRVEKRPPRSVSTPPLRQNTMSDSEQDKKRNKLGYQRISIACGKNLDTPTRVRHPFYASNPMSCHGACTDFVQHIAAVARSDVY